ncbi:MAG: DUF4381 domain-containing protein [Psychromonas sp.]
MSPLANPDPLAQLNDIIGPTSPNWFPPAPLYWALLLLIMALFFGTYYFVKQYKKQQKVQQSLLINLHQLAHNKADFIVLNQLLKACALRYFPRDEVASLHGEQWFDFLQKYSRQTIFKNKQNFMQRLYHVTPQACHETDFMEAKKWIMALPKQIKKAQQDV